MAPIKVPPLKFDGNVRKHSTGQSWTIFGLDDAFSALDLYISLFSRCKDKKIFFHSRRNEKQNFIFLSKILAEKTHGYFDLGKVNLSSYLSEV